MNYSMGTMQLTDRFHLHIVKRLLEENVAQDVILKVLAVLEEEVAVTEARERELQSALSPQFSNAFFRRGDGS